MTREIPIAFSSGAEAIFLVSSILAHKMRMKEFEGFESIFSCPHSMVRAYQKLFPEFEVVDGIVPRFGSIQDGEKYGEKGYFHHHEGRSRSALEGRLKLIPHAWLLFKEQIAGMSPLVVDVVPYGAVTGWQVAMPLCLNEHGPAFTRTKLPVGTKEEDLLKKVHIAVTYLKEIKTEVDALV
jgi:hypothetical protein